MERQFNTNTDTEHFRNDPLVTFKVKGIVNNVVEMLLLGIEES
jgi:hypothetical protein